MKDLVRIRAGGTAAGFVLDRGFGGGGDFFQALDDKRMVRGAVGEGGARAEFDLAVSDCIETRGVGGVSDVQANADSGLETVGRHHGAMAADFLLHGIEADQREGGFALACGDASHHLGDDVAADPIIESAADDPAVGEFHRAVLIDGGMAHADAELGDFRGIRGPDIHPKFVHGGGFLGVFFAMAEVNGGIADDAGNRAFFTKDGNSSATGGRRVGAAYAVEPEKPLIVDVFDHVTDFIGMGGKHDDFFGLAGQCRPGGSVGIALDGGGMVLDPVRPDFLAWHFESGRAGGFQQTI